VLEKESQNEISASADEAQKGKQIEKAHVKRQQFPEATGIVQDERCGQGKEGEGAAVDDQLRPMQR
jgi:hypothetical protein